LGLTDKTNKQLTFETRGMKFDKEIFLPRWLHLCI